MQTKILPTLGFAFCALLLAACGDSNNTPGFGGGGTVCASDDPNIGDTIDCPSGEKTIDFCINTGNGSCYYVIEGEQIGCGNCFEGGAINDCALEAAERCD